MSAARCGATAERNMTSFKGFPPAPNWEAPVWMLEGICGESINYTITSTLCFAHPDKSVLHWLPWSCGCFMMNHVWLFGVSDFRTSYSNRLFKLSFAYPIWDQFKRQMKSLMMLCFVRRRSVARLMVLFALDLVVNNVFEKTTMTLSDARIWQLWSDEPVETHLLKGIRASSAGPDAAFPSTNCLTADGSSSFMSLRLALASLLHSANVSLLPAAVG